MNMNILKFFQQIQNPFFDNLFEYITMLGETNFYIIVIAVIFWCVNKRFGYKIAFALISNCVFNISLKEIFQTARPIGIEGIRSLRTHTAPGYSFPSGHTQGATSFWTSIMLQFKKRWMYILGGVIIFSVGISRLYLAVHWPVDVIGGWIIGITWVFFANWLLNTVEKTDNFNLFFIVIIPALIGLFIFKDSNYFKLTGVLLSFIIGYYVDCKYINYEITGSILKQILNIILGITVILMIKKFVKGILPEALLSDFIRYFLIGIWILVGAPALFMIRPKK